MISLLVRNFLIWFAVGFVSVLVIKGTSIGEVVFTISASRGWGIHSFDLVVFLFGALASAFTIIDYILYVDKHQTEIH